MVELVPGLGSALARKDGDAQDKVLAGVTTSCCHGQDGDGDGGDDGDEDTCVTAVTVITLITHHVLCLLRA